MSLSQEHFFSPSEINTGYGCPFNWNSGRQRLPRIYVETKYADFGHITHQSIAQYYKTISDRPHKGAIKGTFSTIMEENLSASGLKRMGTRKDRCIENFVKFEVKRLKTWKQYLPTHIEEKKQARVGSFNYRTIADVYWEKDETIVDWKSGKMIQIGIIERIQGQVMKMVWNALGFPVRRVIFAALYTGLELEMPATTQGFVESMVRSMFEYNRLGHYPKKKGPLCFWCGFQLRCALEGRCLWM